jgi:hypothetical protein
VIRRRESVELVDDEATKHTHTIDIRLPRGHRARPTEVPLFLVPKAPSTFSRFDLIDETGRRYMIPTLEQNAAISASILVEAAKRLLWQFNPNGSYALTWDQEIYLRMLAEETDREKFEARESIFRDSLRPGQAAILFENEQFDWLLTTLISASIITLTIDFSTVASHILKLSYVSDQLHINDALVTRMSWVPQPVWIDFPIIRAQSFHAEFAAPEGMQVIYSRLKVREDRSVIRKGPKGSTKLDAGITKTDIGDKKRRTHLYVENARHALEGSFFLEMRVRRSAFAGGAALASLAVAVTLSVCAISFGKLDLGGSSPVPILLAFPGLIAALVGRTGMHPMTSRLLNYARFALLGSAALAFASALLVGLLVTRLSPCLLQFLLCLFSTIAWLVAFGLIETWKLPVPAYEREPRFLRIVRKLGR